MKLFRQVIAVWCIGLMLSINAYACVEQIIVPNVVSSDVSLLSHLNQSSSARLSLSPSFHSSLSASAVQSLSSDKVTVNKSVVSLSTQKVTATHFDAVAAKVALKHVSQVKFKPKPASESNPVNRGAKFIPIGTQAYFNFIQHDLVEIRPQYLLAFEFSPPITPSFMVGYRIDANNPSWFLTTFSKNARVSGWKESNLIYRFTHQTA
ncbi:hypothetical protein [Shewanella surugensis]|uniref:Uncharacterized protein n=1 Tax=Shewanella surugensis TaxID=212020 RepID=A0ABT0LAM8_9GAMM|nr:hypothetical protein [Shewanella surugensis]MCL1124723.1 hypothetical protein [Shewanella surugensis]